MLTVWDDHLGSGAPPPGCLLRFAALLSMTLPPPPTVNDPHALHSAGVMGPPCAAHAASLAAGGTAAATGGPRWTTFLTTICPPGAAAGTQALRSVLAVGQCWLLSECERLHADPWCAPAAAHARAA